MIEYRLKTMPDVLRVLLEEADAFIGEEEFKGETTYLIYSEDDISDVLASLNIEFESKDTEETGWQEKWKEFINDGWLTEDIYYVFDRDKKFDDGRKVIYINPSLAFGTGNHPTTQIAARLLAGIVNGKSVLDVGTGSGILAISAELNGAKSVDAFDIDPLGLPNCLENISNNNCKSVNAWTGSIQEISGKKYDVVCANIISSVLLELKEYINNLASEYIVYSGILTSEYDRVKELLCGSDFIEDKVISINEWTGMRLKRCSQ